MQMVFFFVSGTQAVYLDCAGSPLYSTSQVAAYFEDLCSNVYGNPHSASPSSSLTSDVIQNVRNRYSIDCIHRRVFSVNYSARRASVFCIAITLLSSCKELRTISSATALAKSTIFTVKQF